MLKNKLLLFLAFVPAFCFAQLDTVTVMYYNLLNFPNPGNTHPLGNDSARAIAFREIIEAADADIIVVQELTSSAGADMLVTELNNNALGKIFDRADFYFGYGAGSLGNMIFFNTNMASFLQQVEIPQENSAITPDGSVVFSPRPNSYYALEVFSPNNAADRDTLHVLAGHFKSGDGNGNAGTLADRERRVLGVLDMMDYVNENLHPGDNIIAGGDFNFYSHLADNVSDPAHDEPAYDSLMNPVSYPVFFIDKQGGWTREDTALENTCKYTQSTRLLFGEYGNNGPGGGLDDRFDFALINNALDIGLGKMRYIEGSNIAFGSPKILDGVVTDGNSPVKNQLHAMSDHLPVVMQFELSYSADCMIAGISVDGACMQQNYIYSVGFSAGNASGSYEVVDITNGIVVATGNDSPVSVTVPGNSSVTPFDIIVRDANDTLCASMPFTVNPVDCSATCGISINTVNAICKPDYRYDLEVCFDFDNPESTQVNVLVDQATFGPFPYPGSPGGCVVVSSSELNLLGDGSGMLEVRVEDAGTSGSGEPFISEIHYDNDGTDVGEFVEITLPGGIDLGNYSLQFYNGGNGSSYKTVALSGDNTQGDCMALSFPATGMQNGPDGVALVKTVPVVSVIEFLSYEGIFTAVDGTVAGITSVDIGVQESGSTPAGFSLQKTDSGWVGPLASSANMLNDGLTACESIVSSNCFDSVLFSEPDCINPACIITNIQASATCLPGNTYDLDICFDYTEPLSANVNVSVDGVSYGAFAYPVNSTGGCITIPGTTLNLPGDGTAGILIEVEDAASATTIPDSPFISEFHYDNAGTDVGEFVEITAPFGTDLSAYTIVLYNGSNGLAYGTLDLSGIILDDPDNCGAISFPSSLQNGPDAIALVETSSQNVIDFISYGGVILALDGPATGMTSTDVGVTESSSGMTGVSLQKTNAGWVGPLAESPGLLNNDLTNCVNAGINCSASTVFTEPGCNICPIDLTLNETPIVDSLYRVSGNIISAGSVSDGGNVIFDAGVEIELLPEFCVPPGAEFQAIIGGCNGNR